MTKPSIDYHLFDSPDNGVISVLIADESNPSSNFVVLPLWVVLRDLPRTLSYTDTTSLHGPYAYKDGSELYSDYIYAENQKGNIAITHLDDRDITHTLLSMPLSEFKTMASILILAQKKINLDEARKNAFHETRRHSSFKWLPENVRAWIDRRKTNALADHKRHLLDMYAFDEESINKLR